MLQPTDLCAQIGFLLEVRVHHASLVVVDRVDRVGREQVADLLRAQLTIHDSSIPRSSNCCRSRMSPVRIRLFTVPSGWSNIRATSR